MSTAETPRRARDVILDTPELLEALLLQVDRDTLRQSCTSVNKLFHGAINESPLLQAYLFLRPTLPRSLTLGTIPRVNPYLKKAHRNCHIGSTCLYVQLDHARTQARVKLAAYCPCKSYHSLARRSSDGLEYEPEHPLLQTYISMPALPIHLELFYPEVTRHGFIRHRVKVWVKATTLGGVYRVAQELVNRQSKKLVNYHHGRAAWNPRSVTELDGPDEEALDLMTSEPKYYIDVV